VRSFEMRNKRNTTDYFLFFASNNRQGLSKMKEAMWKVAPGGGYSFSDATDVEQNVLFGLEPDRRALRCLVTARFTKPRVRVQQVENFVVDDTPFLSTHYRKVLAEMEAHGALQFRHLEHAEHGRPSFPGNQTETIERCERTQFTVKCLPAATAV